MRLSPVPFLPLLAAALALLCGGPSGASARAHHCQKCECALTISGEYKSAELDKLMRDKVIPKVTGGGKWSWKKPLAPSGKAYKGTADFERLCGYQGHATGSWQFAGYWPLMTTTVAIDCKNCGKVVQCGGGSKCQDSTLYGQWGDPPPK